MAVVAIAVVAITVVAITVAIIVAVTTVVLLASGVAASGARVTGVPVMAGYWPGYWGGGLGTGWGGYYGAPAIAYTPFVTQERVWGKVTGSEPLHHPRRLRIPIRTRSSGGTGAPAPELLPVRE